MSFRSTQLPHMAHVAILQNFDSIRSLVEILDTDVSLRHTFDLCPGIAETVIQRQIHRQLLPLAIANIEASHKTYTLWDIQDVKNLYLDVFENPSRFTDRLKVPDTRNPIPMGDLVRMGDIHSGIGRIMKRYMEQAWEKS
ncbi:hypothetical protein CIB48_g8622 [Xylaria polymorpha]|nr:hypothetical protein CIB48_g8622 [Xylaria polymorpha]